MGRASSPGSWVAGRSGISLRFFGWASVAASKDRGRWLGLAQASPAGREALREADCLSDWPAGHCPGREGRLH